jgi:hypothetical protein
MSRTVHLHPAVIVVALAAAGAAASWTSGDRG